jgi:hypothetical protein
MTDLFQNEPPQPSNCSLQQLVERLPAEQVHQNPRLDGTRSGRVTVWP